MDSATISPLTPTAAGLEPKHMWASVVRFWLRIQVSESRFNWIWELEFWRNYSDRDCNWTSCICENVVFFWVCLLHELATQEHIYDNLTKENISQRDTWANPLPSYFTPSLNFTLSRERVIPSILYLSCAHLFPPSGYEKEPLPANET